MADTASSTETPAANDAKQTPPWGDDFDAAKAWNLIQALRTDKETLKTERDAARTKIQEIESSAASESEQVAAAVERAKKAERELWTERALRKHPDLDEDLVEFLTGDSEEEIAKKAERLASIGKPKADKPAGDEDPKDDEDEAGGKPDDDEDLPGMPKPNLTPGHGGETPPPFDPAAIAKAARRR